MSYALPRGSIPDTKTFPKRRISLNNTKVPHTTQQFQQEIFWASDSLFTDRLSLTSEG